MGKQQQKHLEKSNLYLIFLGFQRYSSFHSVEAQNKIDTEKESILPTPLPSSLSAFDDPQEPCFLDIPKLSCSSETDAAVLMIPSCKHINH